MISIRIVWITTTKRKMSPLMVALPYPSKVSTESHNGTISTDTVFEVGEFDTSLTKVLKPIEGLEILTLCNSTMHTDINTGEVCVYADQLPTVCVPKIPPAPAGKTDGKTARLRRVPGSTEPFNDLAPVAGSIPRSFDSIPSP